MKITKLTRFVAAALVAVAGLLITPTRAPALFGVGDTVFDPTMYATQLVQLGEEVSTVSNLAQQLSYEIQNTTGGSAGIWKSNQTLLTNLGGLISEQQGLSYSVQGLAQQFQQLYPGYNVTAITGVQSPQASVATTLNTLNGALQTAQSQAQNFTNEQTALQSLELKNQTAAGNLQAVQTGNEIALAQVQQIQMLRQLVMTMMNSENTAAGSQINNQTQSQLGALAIIGAAPQVSAVAQSLQPSGQPPPQ
jgi:P-type conjugative transfer protein TrbJ